MENSFDYGLHYPKELLGLSRLAVCSLIYFVVSMTSCAAVAFILMLARLEVHTLAPWVTLVYSGRHAVMLLPLRTASSLVLLASIRRMARIAVGMVSPSAAFLSRRVPIFNSKL